MLMMPLVGVDKPQCNEAPVTRFSGVNELERRDPVLAKEMHQRG